MDTKLLQHLIVTKDPFQFAAVIRRNVEMDLTCVMAVPGALKKLDINIPSLTLQVEVDGGQVYTFCSPQSNINGGTFLVDLVLRRNHYQLRGEFNENRNPSEGLANDCLYEALTEVIPALRNVTSAEFRQAVSGNIETDPDIQRYIRHGHHQTLLQRGVFGGNARKKTDISPAKKEDDTDESKNNENAVADHLCRRFKSVFALAGIAQWVSEVTGISRVDVFHYGGSQGQDESSTTQGNHAAHIIRMQINPELEEWPNIYRFLQNTIGGTNDVPAYANRFWGIGGQIDTAQIYLLTMLLTVDYSNPNFTGNYGRNVIEGIRDYLMILSNMAELETHPTRLPKSFFYQVENVLNDGTSVSDTVFSRELANMARDLFLVILRNSLNRAENVLQNPSGRRPNQIANYRAASTQIPLAMERISNFETEQLLELGRAGFWYLHFLNPDSMEYSRNVSQESYEGINYEVLRDIIYYDPPVSLQEIVNQFYEQQQSRGSCNDTIKLNIHKRDPDNGGGGVMSSDSANGGKHGNSNGSSTNDKREPNQGGYISKRIKKALNGLGNLSKNILIEVGNLAKNILIEVAGFSVAAGTASVTFMSASTFFGTGVAAVGAKAVVAASAATILSPAVATVATAAMTGACFIGTWLFIRNILRGRVEPVSDTLWKTGMISLGTGLIAAPSAWPLLALPFCYTIKRCFF